MPQPNHPSSTPPIAPPAGPLCPQCGRPMNWVRTTRTTYGRDSDAVSKVTYRCESCDLTDETID